MYVYTYTHTVHIITCIVILGERLVGCQHPGEVFFHYTNHVAFVNITHTVKEAAEIYASLNISGPHANAWWGQGVYTVPKPPDQWENRGSE